MFCPKIHSNVGFPGGSVVKNLPASAGHVGLIPGLESSPGGRNGSPLQYSCLDNPIDRGNWWGTVHGVARVRYDWACPHRVGTNMVLSALCFLLILQKYHLSHYKYWLIWPISPLKQKLQNQLLSAQCPAYSKCLINMCWIIFPRYQVEINLLQCSNHYLSFPF